MTLWFMEFFDRCLGNLTLVLKRFIDTNPVLNWRKYHLMVNQGIMLGHVISERGIKVDKSKISYSLLTTSH